MKNKKVLFLISLFLLVIFLFDRVSAFTITGSASSRASTGTNNPYSGGGSGEAVSMETLSHPRIAFVGLLASLIEYDNTNGPNEKVVKKIFYTTGNTGGFSSNFDAESYYQYGNHSDYFKASTGIVAGCGNQDYHNKKIEHFYMSVKYASPELSPSLVGVPENSSYSFTAGDLESFIYGTILQGIINEYENTSPHTVMGYEIDERAFDKYYLKYEPVYRTYPPLAQKNSQFRGGYSPSENIAHDFMDPLDSPIIDDDVRSYIQFLNDYPDLNDTYHKLHDCGHTHADYKYEYVNHYNDMSKEECDEAGYNYDDDDGCYYTQYESVEHPESPVNCFVIAEYKFHAIQYNNVKTTMSTVREGYTSSIAFTGSLFSSYSDNRQDVMDETSGLVETGVSDYYIGTTPNNAMAISNYGVHKFDASKHMYKLVESGNESYSSDKTLGMGLFNLSEVLDEKNICDPPCIKLTCPEVCADYINDKSSDDYLRCAQSYCDSTITFSPTEYATDLKRSCILDKDQCDYHPKTPIDCENTVNSTIKNEASSDGTDGKTINDSSCGFTGNSYTNDNRTVNKERGSYYFCQRMGNGTKSTDTNGKTYYKYGVSNTTDSYINIECKENVGFDFTDLSSTKLMPGLGFEYATYLDGSKTCRIFFDTASWEFDFASTHSYDSTRKKLLLQKVNAFNLLQSNKSGNVKVNGSELLGKVIDQEGTTEKLTLDDVEDDLIFLSALNYNVGDDKGTSNSKVTENIDNKANTSGNSVYEEGERFNLEITNRSNPTSYYSTKKSGGINLYHDYILGESRQINEEGKRDIYEYTVSGTGSITYQLPRICTATDNRRTLKRSYEDSCDGLGKLYNKSVPLREYYTSLKALPNTTSLKNNMNNQVSVKKSYFSDTVSGSEEYLKGEDTCPYDVYDDIHIDKDINCEIFVEKKGTCYKSNDSYISTDPEVKARLLVHNNTNDIIDVDTQKIELVGSNISGEVSITVDADNLKTKTKSNGKIVSNNKYEFKGTLTVHSNDPTYTITNPTINCYKSINIIEDSKNCTITKDGTSYYITPNGAGNVYAAMLSNTDRDGNILFTPVTLEENGKYVYQVITDSKNEAIIAKIGDGSVTSYCTYIPTNCPSINACIEKFEPSQTKLISDYCSTNYEIDKYHYDSPTICYDDCTTHSPDPNKKYCVRELTAKERENFNTVDTFCKSTDSAQGYDDCMDDCLNINPPGTSPYIYRSINLNNPFPSSKFSASSGYQGGKRAIGQEWLIHYDKIDEDKVQIMNGTEPEYVVELDVARISAIRNDTYTRNEGLESGSIYSDTTNLPKIASCTSSGYKGYCSSFIHEDFTDYFKIVMGHKN